MTPPKTAHVQFMVTGVCCISVYVASPLYRVDRVMSLWFKHRPNKQSITMKAEYIKYKPELCQHMYS